MKKLFYFIGLSSDAGIAIGAALFLSVAGGAALAKEPLKLFDLTIPDRVAGLPHGRRHELGTESVWGYEVPFRRSGWEIFVYFDNKMLDTFKNEDLHLVREKMTLGGLKASQHTIDVVVEDRFMIARDGHEFSCSTFVSKKGKSGAGDHYMCDTVWKNKFFTIEMSTHHNKTSREEARKFIEAWIPVLWPSK